MICYLIKQAFYYCLPQLQEAKKAYESVMVVTPRRPTTEEFFEFEKHAMGLSSELYDYQWPQGSEVGNTECI